MKQVSFEGKAFEDFTHWATQDKKIYAKIITLPIQV
jgi:Txe/YoeB family toxin of Txe-Axe toxin-antitoxin module